MIDADTRIDFANRNNQVLGIMAIPLRDHVRYYAPNAWPRLAIAEASSSVQQLEAVFVNRGVFVVHGADERELVAHGGHFGEQFCEVDPGCSGGNRSERATDFARGVGLGIPRVKLAGAAG